MRPTPDELRRRWCQAILEALEVNGGWLSREQIRLGMGQGYIDPSDLDAALVELRLRGLILAKKRRKGVGKHGRPRTVYAATTARLVLIDATRDAREMSPIALDPDARAALFDYARARFLAARADAEASLETEAFWRTTATALAAPSDLNEAVNVEDLPGASDAAADPGEGS